MRLILCLLTAASVLATGIARRIKPLSEPQFKRGYRSTLAMKNQATWDMAQRESAAALIPAGAAGMALSWAISTLVEGDLAIAISLAVSSALAAITVAWTEKRLSSAFDADGNRRRAGGTGNEED